MVARVCSAVVSGPIVQPVTIEVESSRTSLPTVSIIGLPNASVRESKDRVFSALRSLPLSLPRKRLVISLRPVEMSKSGSSLDLAIALGILAALGCIPNQQYCAIGELGLDGVLHGSSEYLALLDSLPRAGPLYAPADCSQYWRGPLSEHDLRFCQNLKEAFSAVSGECCFLPNAKKEMTVWNEKVETPPGVQRISKSLLRTLTIALSGGHHVLLFGSPGIGKSYARNILPFLQPKETPEQIWERCVRESVVGQRKSGLSGVVAPLNNATVAGLVGGGTPVRFGAVSQAHRGVLFLDELPEFSRECLECLRQPLENESITLVRGSGAWELPCSFTLIATANPCPCGYYGENRCTCSAKVVQRYVRQLSGPVLDRIDIQIRLSSEDKILLSLMKCVEIARRITAVRRVQENRMKDGFPEFARQYQEVHINQLPTPEAVKLPSALFRGWSLRRKLKLRRVAQTIADVDGSERVTKAHFLEAFQLVRPSFAEILDHS